LRTLARAGTFLGDEISRGTGDRQHGDEEFDVHLHRTFLVCLSLRATGSAEDGAATNSCREALSFMPPPYTSEH
jgi:hypothetical protein